MRLWQAGVGELLVEVSAGAFVLLADDGASRSFDGLLGSSQEHLSFTTYAVVGAQLVWTYEEKNSDLPDEPATRRTSIALAGLVELAATPELLARVQGRLSADARRAAAARAASEDRDARHLRDFKAALPEASGPELVFVWRYHGAAIVISFDGGAELWREEGYPFHGKYLYAELQRALQERYGARFKSLKLDLSDEGASRFDPE